MALRITLKIEMLDGKTINTTVLSYSVGISQTEGKARGPDFQSIVLTKHIDATSPFLSLACAKGTVVERATLSVFCQDRIFKEYRLHDCLITSLSPPSPICGSSCADSTRFEQLTISYSGIDWVYFDADTGKETAADSTR